MRVAAVCIEGRSGGGGPGIKETMVSKRRRKGRTIGEKGDGGAEVREAGSRELLRFQ
jgi:hypothetical protein